MRAPASLLTDAPPDSRTDIPRARAVWVEELLIALKRTWPAVAEGEGVRRAESPRLLARFVTICVEEYYSPLG